MYLVNDVDGFVLVFDLFDDLVEKQKVSEV